MFEYHARLIRVLDGDTVEMDLDLGFDVHYVSPVRLKGINAPELHGETHAAGLAARDHLAQLLSKSDLIVRTELHKDKDKYGRVLGTFLSGEINVNAQMIDDGFAVPYLT